MSLALTCQSGGNRVHGTHWRAACGKPATVVILYDQEVWHAGDVQEDILTSYPVCADHAAEEVHETRQCMAEDEFVVVNLPLPASSGTPWPARAGVCGHYDPMLGPCVCGDKANHQPGGRYYSKPTRVSHTSGRTLLS